MAFAKVSIDGLNGSGKTWTSGLLAAGLAKEYGSGAVHVFDSSDRWRFLKRLLFDPERIPVVITHGRSMLALQNALDRAAKEGCSVFVGDDISIPWTELLESFGFKDGRLPIERNQQVRREWNVMVRKFLDGRFHAIGCGRLGYNWENAEDENGSMQLVQGDSKFNAGGGNNFGYECELELEMRRKKRKILSLIRGKNRTEYICDVVKDATSVINGHQFIFQSFDNYKPGAYRSVLDGIRPYLDFVQGCESVNSDPSSSRELLVSGQSAWAKDQSERAALLQELDANLEMCFGSNRSTQGKMFRNLTLEYLNGFISWGRMEEESQTEDIRRNVYIVKAIRKRIEAGEIPTEQKSLDFLLNLATEDVLHPGRNVSLLEAMGAKSIAQAKARKGPQPVIPSAEMQREDEVGAD